MHSKAIIDSSVILGYVGTRQAENSSYRAYSDFDIPARNSWAGGISLFRSDDSTSSLPEKMECGNQPADISLSDRR